MVTPTYSVLPHTTMMHTVYSSPITGLVVGSTMDICTVDVTGEGSGVGVALGVSNVSDGTVADY